MLTPPLAPISRPLLYLSPLLTLPLFYLLGGPAFLARGANTHPLLSLVCYQLFTPCCYSHPKAPHRSSYNIYIDDINISRFVWYSMWFKTVCVLCWTGSQEAAMARLFSREEVLEASVTLGVKKGLVISVYQRHGTRVDGYSCLHQLYFCSPSRFLCD